MYDFLRKFLPEYYVNKFRRLIIGKNKLQLIQQVRSAFEIYYEGIREWDYDTEYGESTLVQKPKTTTNISQLGIQYIKLYDSSEKLIIRIKLSRPGLFIGKGGNEIGLLQNHISERVKKPVQFKLEECRGLWEDQQ